VPRCGFCETFVVTLNESVISQVGSDPFKPEPIGAKFIQLPFQFCNGRFAARCREMEDLITGVGQSAPAILR
jgi:hypothetical protein